MRMTLGSDRFNLTRQRRDIILAAYVNSNPLLLISHRLNTGLHVAKPFADTIVQIPVQKCDQ